MGQSYVLPVGIFGVWAGGEPDFCMRALKRDVEPCQESVYVCRRIGIHVRYIHEDLEVVKATYSRCG